MSIFVFRSKASVGARQLADSLDGRRIRQVENLNRMVRPGDLVICWGENWSRPGVEVLNGGVITSKLTDALKLAQGGVPTIQVSRTRPVQQQAPVPIDPALERFLTAQTMAEEFIQAHMDRGEVYLRGLMNLNTTLGGLYNALQIPAPIPAPAVPIGDWFGRTSNHVGGVDLLNPPVSPDYWVKKETFSSEVRIHCFKGKSIRAGKKVQRRDFAGTRSEWVKSYDGGWKLDYNDFKSSQAMKDIAARAIEVLGLDFGAVDIGIKSDNSLVVLEVNRAPGLEGGTVEAYAQAVERYEEEKERAA